MSRKRIAAQKRNCMLFRIKGAHAAYVALSLSGLYTDKEKPVFDEIIRLSKSLIGGYSRETKKITLMIKNERSGI